MFLLLLILSIGITYSETAYVQIFHNKPYEAVDIYIDGQPYYVGLKYQESLRPVNVPLQSKIGVAPRGLDVEKSIRLNLTNQKKYMLVINGVSENQNYPTDLKLLELEDYEEDNQLIGFKFLHGIADAPPLDIYLNRDLIIQGQSYGEFNDLIEIPSGPHVIDFTRTRSSEIIARFNLELTNAGQETALLLVTGFLSPALEDSSLTMIISAYDEDPVKFEPAETFLLGTTYEDLEIPTDFYVLQNYPNPFNPTTSIEYDIFDDSFVKITVFDMAGSIVDILADEKQDAGRKKIVWNATTDVGAPLSSGIYFYKVEVDGSTQIKRMMYLK